MAPELAPEQFSACAQTCDDRAPNRRRLYETRITDRFALFTPLPRQAIAILKELQEETGDSKLLFPCTRSKLRPMSDNTINAAFRRMGYTKDEVTAHGFRATASTLLNESGKFSPDAIERALAHQDPDAIRRAYARGAYWAERVAMAQWWADHLDVLKEGGKVIEMRPAARSGEQTPS